MRVVVEKAASSSAWWRDVAAWAVAAGLLGVVLGAWFNAHENRKQRAADRRRELTVQYGQALALAVSWTEVPYRVARRTSDDPETIALIVEHVHSLQEQLEANRQWLMFESVKVGSAYQQLVGAAKTQCEPHIRAAWLRDPATTAQAQNLGALYRADIDDACATFRAAAEDHIESMTFVSLNPFASHSSTFELPGVPTRLAPVDAEVSQKESNADDQ